MNIEGRLGLGRVLAVLTITAILAGCGGSGSDELAGAAGSTPSVSGTPSATVAANADYSFRPKSASPAGTSLLFSIQNKPTWATFGSLTGQLSGTPGTSDAGNYPNIVIAATDGTTSVALPGFSIRVTSPALVSTAGSSSGGTSSTASTGSSSSGAGSTTGSSSGTTVAGTSSSSSSSGGASIPSSDTVSLSWVAPTQNTDGSALTNLAGYDIYYGNSATAMTQKITISTVGMLTYVVTNLTPGTWYFEVISVNASGVDSGPSSTVSTTI